MYFEFRFFLVINPLFLSLIGTVESIFMVGFDEYHITLREIYSNISHEIIQQLSDGFKMIITKRTKSEIQALPGRLQRLCPAVSRRAQSSDRFFSYFTPPICWGSSNSMNLFLICTLTIRRSAATLLRRMSCSCRSGFRDAWMTLRNGCSPIVFNSTQPRRKCSGMHPFDVSIRFHSPVYVSTLTSLFRLLLSETSEYIWDCDISMRTHVSKVVSSCFAVLRRLRSIRSSVTRPVFVSLVVSMVLSRLDYGNATLAGITVRLMDRLRSVLNASARLIYASRRTEHVTPLLRDLH